MFIGFDYGTANCSVAVMRDHGPELLTLENNEPYLPSMLCAPTREAVSECLHRHWQVPTGSEENQQLLRRAISYNREEDIPVNGDSVLFGLQALAHYMEDPEEVYFVRSPKSFLGANGLKPQQIALFEDLVCAMMFHIKRQAENVLQTGIEQAVIGRPINFQGIGGEEANRQAQGILQRAAERAGFKAIEFQFEPVAAGLDFEATLSEEQTVLVVDIGGGTTDCSVLLMGPQWRDRADRQQSLLGHSGCRVGGNDLDIMLAFKQLMPLFGLGGETAKGIALPALPYWNAVATNDVPAQNDFYSAANGRVLRDLILDAAEPEKVKRLLKVYQQRLSYRLVRAAEESKIALSGQTAISAPLGFVQADLAESISQAQLADAISQPLMRIQEQVSAALASSQTAPQVIYLTGGSARSPAARRAATAAAWHSDRRRQRLRLGHRRAGALGANAVPLTARGRARRALAHWRLYIMSTILTLDSARLRLRPWRDEDLPAFAALNADPQVMRYFPATMTAEESRAQAERIRAFMQQHGWGLWAVEVKDSAPFIGFVGLARPSDDLPCSPCVEIGWRLAAAHWGNGYAAEAARAALACAFDTLHLPEVVSFTAENNQPSRRVMTRIGMQFDGETFLHPRLPAGHPLQKHVLYRLNRQTWRERRGD